MKTSICRVNLSRSEVEYLTNSGFLPQALHDCLREIQWRSGVLAALELSTDMAEQFRGSLTEQLAKVGFNEAYELTVHGRLLEGLIDSFQRRS